VEDLRNLNSSRSWAADRLCEGPSGMDMLLIDANLNPTIWPSLLRLSRRVRVVPWISDEPRGLRFRSLRPSKSHPSLLHYNF
jgi:hypothetical protein